MTLWPHSEGWNYHLQLEHKISFDLSHYIAREIAEDSRSVITSSLWWQSWLAKMDVFKFGAFELSLMILYTISEPRRRSMKSAFRKATNRLFQMMRGRRSGHCKAKNRCKSKMAIGHATLQRKYKSFKNIQYCVGDRELSDIAPNIRGSNPILFWERLGC